MKRLLLPLLILLLAAMPALAEDAAAAMPSLTPTPVPEPQTDPQTASAISTVDLFFYVWRTGSVEALLNYTSPDWRSAQKNPQEALTAICTDYVPTSLAEIQSISGTKEDSMRTVRAKVTMHDTDGSKPDAIYVFHVVVSLEDGKWYVYPDSFARKSKLTPTPTPEYDRYSAPDDLPLYYQPGGDPFYHRDPDCAQIDASSRPLTEYFLYGEMEQEPYANLVSCGKCQAPMSQRLSWMLTPTPARIPEFDVGSITPYSTPTPVITPSPEPFQSFWDSVLTPTPVPTAPGTPSPIPVYVDGVLTPDYQRETPIGMPCGDDYMAVDFALSTWRGDSFRRNAAVGVLDVAPESLELLWSVAIADDDRNAFAGFYGDVQPLIVNWPVEIREITRMTEPARSTRALKEVLMPGQDGRIHCLNLADGSLTREPIDLGYSIDNLTLHPLSYPLLLVGHDSASLATATGQVGMRYIETATGHTLRFVDGEAAFPAMRVTEGDPLLGYFVDSSLIDRTTNTAIFLSIDGWLFTETLNTTLSQSPGLGETRKLRMQFNHPQSVAARILPGAANAAPVMYGNLLWACGDDGRVVCVDTTTIQILWEQEGEGYITGQAMELTDDGLRLYVCRSGKNAGLDCRDAYTGELLFSVPFTGGYRLLTDLVVGQNGLSGKVFLSVDDSRARTSWLCCVDTASGTGALYAEFPSDYMVNPVAVYDAQEQGYIIAGYRSHDNTTTLVLLDGDTGDVLSTITLEGSLPSSPAAYGDKLVIAVNTDTDSYIHCLQLKGSDPARDVADAFLTAWSQNDGETMLALCAPSWRSTQSNPTQRLFIHRANRTPLNWTFETHEGHLLVRILFDRNDGSDPRWYTGSVNFKEEDGQTWIDPSFLTWLTPDQ